MSECAGREDVRRGCLTVERAHAVRGRRLLQRLLNLLPPLGFVLQSFLEFPLGLLLLLQTLLNDC